MRVQPLTLIKTPPPQTQSNHHHPTLPTTTTDQNESKLANESQLTLVATPSWLGLVERQIDI